MKHLTLAAVIIVALTAISGCSSPKAGCDLLFESRSTDTIPYRIPAIAELERGTLLALADYRHCGSDIGFGRVDIHGRIAFYYEEYDDCCAGGFNMVYKELSLEEITSDKSRK